MLVLVLEGTGLGLLLSCCSFRFPIRELIHCALSVRVDRTRDAPSPASTFDRQCQRLDSGAAIANVPCITVSPLGGHALLWLLYPLQIIVHRLDRY